MPNGYAKVLMILALTPISCQVTQEQKALRSFKSLVRRHVDSYKTNSREKVAIYDVVHEQVMLAKERFSIDPTSVTFDVEKTSSLVSPFMGTLTFVVIVKVTNQHLTQTEAAGDTVFTHEFRSTHKHVFVYQDGKWQPTTRQHTYEGIWVDCVYENSDPFGCLEEYDGDR